MVIKAKFQSRKKTNQQGFGHVELLLALIFIAAFAFIGIRVLTRSHAQTPTTSLSTNCKLSPIDVPSCGVLWGAYVPSSGLASLESQVGRQFDIFQSYHDFSTTNSGQIPNSGDRTLMSGGRILLASWQNRIYSSGAVDSWATIAAGDYDSTVIIPQAQRIKALGSTKVFLSFAPEMNDTSTHPVATYGTAADYVAAYQHIHNVFAAQGVTNVIWVWTPTGSSSSLSTEAPFYPGDAYVDWVGYDPYNFYQCFGDTTWKSAYATFSRFYNWVATGGLGSGAESKPLIMDEYGSHDNAADPIANDTNWYAQIPSALSQLPRLKALSEFDSAGDTPSGSCSTALTSAADIAGFKQAGLSSVVEGTSPPDTTPPTAKITSPVNNAVVKGTLTISGTASDNVGVAKVEMFVDNNLVATDTSAPYTFTLNTTKYSNGSHTIYLEAFDAAGNHGYSSRVTVSVQNSSIYGHPGPITGIDSKCLDNANNLKVAFNRVQLYKCTGVAAETWTANASGSIVNSNGYCLDVHGDSTAVDTVVDLYPCNGTPAQIWKINTTTNTIVDPHSGLCLDDKDASTANGNGIWMSTCNGTAGQVWHVV